ncbi:MAG: type I glyceraldehyde-3-phosphate dehydrogenase [Candidatus Andersenbacteria bacterium RIFCSPHIGHO2_12_FULL_46_9]|nr:MAG: Glyceraldehyde 3-phosphate dehydrogenase [Parcubacteria group bacterium GW2011_GWA2_45_14]OGY35652.1 MAG: type I glyceraldehyde-3-phosphate dehydrogenase [Candidatus Andersenbacteria bacterium RIFCSPHIGHO2_02_FULL_46_16]OGY36854.1 MAG: type I glyceraldehyde-3-phosphate dehydrogenase [Candidatus Andersenbacteria bacterium RIFCSPLOWO2_02_FULL_46_11]OGY37828.1 MAG: type I glyceraldehyde-3-phosphate dehydrogenase [Candidatus Andersenbacteria bacterium RIFCSPHIGHO2_12_FULL_46_9]OGY41654.1 MA
MEESKKIKLAINGFGRIGRAACKVALEHDEIELVAINDLGEMANLAYLLCYDSVYGRYSRAIKVEEDGLVVGDKKIKVYGEAEPKKLPWDNLGVDVVIESTGVFNDKAGAAGHIEAGAKKVIISAPTKDESIPTIVLGVNDEEMAGNDIISNASCTTNSAAPVVKVINELFGIKKAMLTTVHAYTATQGLVDGPAKNDWRRGRAAGINITPSSTGAAVAATLAYPKIKGKFDGVALRVPVAVVSISDFVMLLKKKVTVEDINAAFEDVADKGGDKGVLGVTSEPVASSDFIGDPRSAIIDLAMTRVVDGDLVKVMAWYDNEWGYANRLIEQVILLGK